MAFTAQQLEAQMPDTRQLLSDEPEIESSLHYAQLALLVACLEYLWRDRADFFLGANLTIYFSREQLKHREFRGPDFFLVKGVSPEPRNAWVVWEEDGRYPNLIIELLSASTANGDRTLKKQRYQDRFRTPEYFWFSPETLEFAGFRLEGNHYAAIAPDARGWRWSDELGLFLGVRDKQLRYFLPTGELVPTPAEAARQAEILAQQAEILRMEERQQAEAQIAAERERAERAEREAELLRERLRSLGLSANDDHLM